MQIFVKKCFFAFVQVLANTPIDRKRLHNVEEIWNEFTEAKSSHFLMNHNLRKLSINVV